MQLNLPKLQAEGREKQDIKATVTVAMAVVTFYACYLPAIPTQSGEVTQNTSRNTFGFPFWLLFVRLFQALPTLSSTYYETKDTAKPSGNW